MKTRTFTVGQRVRYKPGFGTYGCEDALKTSPDGRVPGVVVGHSPKRVRVRLTLDLGREITRSVDAVSLMPEAGA